MMALCKGIAACKIVTPSVVLFAVAFFASSPLAHQYVYKSVLQRLDNDTMDDHTAATTTAITAATTTADSSSTGSATGDTLSRLDVHEESYSSPLRIKPSGEVDDRLVMEETNVAAAEAETMTTLATTTTKPRLIPCEKNASSPQYKRQMKAQARTSYILLINNLCGAIPVGD